MPCDISKKKITFVFFSLSHLSFTHARVNTREKSYKIYLRTTLDHHFSLFLSEATMEMATAVTESRVFNLDCSKFTDMKINVDDKTARNWFENVFVETAKYVLSPAVGENDVSTTKQEVLDLMLNRIRDFILSKTSAVECHSVMNWMLTKIKDTSRTHMNLYLDYASLRASAEVVAADGFQITERNNRWLPLFESMYVLVVLSLGDEQPKSVVTSSPPVCGHATMNYYRLRCDCTYAEEKLLLCEFCYKTCDLMQMMYDHRDNCPHEALSVLWDRYVITDGEGHYPVSERASESENEHGGGGGVIDLTGSSDEEEEAEMVVRCVQKKKKMMMKKKKRFTKKTLNSHLKINNIKALSRLLKQALENVRKINSCF